MVEGPNLDAIALKEAELLIAYLHEQAEFEKARFTRELHDDLAGYMVAAAMDLCSARSGLASVEPQVQKRFERIRLALESAIDLSRQIVEDLRPSILDNLGLFAALHWQLKRASRYSNAICTDSYPAVEPVFESVALTVLFRIAQDALAMSFKRGSVTSADLTVRISEEAVSMRFTDDGIAPTLGATERHVAMMMSSMRYRMRMLGGTVDVRNTPEGETILTAQMPLTKH
jgi:signal transduction histidine kinase